MNFKLNGIGTALGVVFLSVISVVGYKGVASAEYVKVVDGDSLEIGKRRIRLLEIDAPEYKQYCFDKNHEKYDCGKDARRYLDDLLKEKAYKIQCKKIDEDRYNRELSECFIDDLNINLEMIEAGWAVTYRTNNPLYLEAEKRAKISKKGIWQGKFMRPEYYRRLHRR